MVGGASNKLLLYECDIPVDKQRSAAHVCQRLYMVSVQFFMDRYVIEILETALIIKLKQHIWLSQTAEGYPGLFGSARASASVISCYWIFLLVCLCGVVRYSIRSFLD